MNAVLLTLAIAADLTGHALRRTPTTGRIPTWAADHALDQLAAQARRPRGLDFTTPVPTARFG